MTPLNQHNIYCEKLIYIYFFKLDKRGNYVKNKMYQMQKLKIWLVSISNK